MKALSKKKRFRFFMCDVPFKSESRGVGMLGKGGGDVRKGGWGTFHYHFEEQMEQG